MIKNTSREYRLLLFLLGLTLLRGIIYIASIPPWQSPDEPTHLEYVQLLAESRHLTGPVKPETGLEKEIIASMDRSRFWEFNGSPRPDPLPAAFAEVPFFKFTRAQTQLGRKPPLYYLTASLLLRVFPGSDLVTRLYLLRSLSLVFTLSTIALIFFTARLVVPEDHYFPALAAAGAAFLPEFMVIGTSVSYEPLASLLGAFFIYLLIRTQVRGITPGNWLLLSLTALAGVLVSYKCLVLPAIYLLTLLIQLFLPLRKGERQKAVAAVLSTALLFLLAYCFLIWNRPELIRLFMGRLNVLYQKAGGWLGGELRPASHYFSWYHREVFKSFFLKFGWARYSAGEGYYLFLKLLGVASLLGWIIWFVRVKRKMPRVSREQARSLLTLLGAVITVTAIYYLYWGVGWRMVTAQGRHLFLALPAWTILFCFGWRAFGGERRRKAIYLFLLLCWVALDNIALFAYIIPTFR
jgi:hypothetical protein